LQNQPGPERRANVRFSTAQTDLGRPLSTGTVVVNVIEPGTRYGERATLLDLRVAKIFAFGNTRLRAMFDIFNVLNENAVTGEILELVPGAEDRYLAPTAIVPGRLAKFAFQLDF